MASYPTSVIAFATRSNGQTIDASHVNGLQDEVTALEDGLLNATARLNSSNSTHVNLSVTGGSTVVTLSVTGASTFAGVIAYTAQPCCACLHASSQTLSTGTEVKVTFDTELFDIGGLHSTTTNPTRFTLPTSGIYSLEGAASFDAAGVGRRYLYWMVNNSSAVGTAAETDGHGSTSFSGLHVWGVHQAASSGDFVELVAFTKDVAPLNNGGGTGLTASRALVRRIA